MKKSTQEGREQTGFVSDCEDGPACSSNCFFQSHKGQGCSLPPRRQPETVPSLGEICSCTLSEMAEGDGSFLHLHTALHEKADHKEEREKLDDQFSPQVLHTCTATAVPGPCNDLSQ